jgi:hypothetical protein
MMVVYLTVVHVINSDTKLFKFNIETNVRVDLFDLFYPPTLFVLPPNPPKGGLKFKSAF